VIGPVDMLALVMEFVVLKPLAVILLDTRILVAVSVEAVNGPVISAEHVTGPAELTLLPVIPPEDCNAVVVTSDVVSVPVDIDELVMALVTLIAEDLTTLDT